MAINFTRLFTALGKIIGSVNSVNTYRGTTLPARVSTIDSQYVSPNQSLIDGLYAAQDSAQVNGHEEWLGYLSDLAYQTLFQECNLDRPVIDPSTGSLLATVARGLRAAGETITEAPAVLADVPSLTVGDAQLVFAAGVNPSDLYTPDSYLIEVTSDQTTGATAFSEFLTITGKQSVGLLDWRWPQGSGVQLGLAVTDSANDTLVSSLFTTGWTTSGTVDTTGSYPDPRNALPGLCAELTGNNSYVQYQLPVLAPGTYTWTVFVDMDGANNAADSLEIQIVDANGGIVATLDSVPANNDPGVWHQFSGVWNFTTQPPVSPSTFYLRFRVDAANPCVVNVLWPGFDFANPLYAGGPVLYCWSGTLPLGLADKWTASVTRASSETLGLYRGLVRLFDLPTFSPQTFLPTGNPGTYTNALVV